MALDNAQFIAELSITDPPGSDPLSQGDDQIRTIKRATQQSFPNIDKAVTQTADQMLQMAIKNEANVFTADQTIQDNELIINAAADVGNQIQFQRAGVLRWTLTVSPDSTDNEFVLARFDDLGAFIDRPWEVDRLTGIVNFAKVPTIQGDPIWTAGEIKLLVQGAALPATNWFLANGTNGTVALQDRILGAQGVFTGTQSPFLDAQTTVGPTTGAHTLTASQMPSHRHRLKQRGATGSGIADGSFLTNTEGLAGVRNTSAGGSFVDAGTDGQFVENTGSGSSHLHTIPELEVETAGLDAFQVMPFTYFMQVIQYVP